MFDKKIFANILRKIKNTYASQEEFSSKTGISRTYLSFYMNQKNTTPPKPSTLQKIANASNGVTSYQELMQVCGYIEKEFSLSDGFSSNNYKKFEEKRDSTTLDEKAQHMLDYMEKNNLDSLTMIAVYRTYSSRRAKACRTAHRGSYSN